MKILMVDKYYFVKGGAERYFFELAEILKLHGHEVIPFSMKHEKNSYSRYQDYFVENIEFNNLSLRQKLTGGLKIVSRMIYSKDSRRRLEKLINETKPDIAHLHMIDHQISPSILYCFAEHNIPVIQTVHHYKLICPNYRLYNMRTRQICEKCLDRRFYHPIFERCHKGSFVASFLVSIETYIHKLMKVYENYIDIFHVPSYFMAQKLVEGGIEPAKIHQLYYTIDVDNYPYHPSFQDYFVYFGRLSAEKGIHTLLKALKKVNNGKLLIIGEGEEREHLERFVSLNDIENVMFLGNMSDDELKTSVSNAMFVIVPSEWYDNSPLVIYESFSMGKPVVGSRIGGITELISDGQDGFLFEPGNDVELTEKIEKLLNSHSTIKTFSANARGKAKRLFDPEAHYHRIAELYSGLLNSRSKRINRNLFHQEDLID